jgi:methionyl-tRNA synthetase
MRYYLTTPIYYVNSSPHIGHAYTTIAADILVRHRRQRGEQVFFLTGVDEHATKVYRVAEQEGLTAQEYVDQIAVVWRELAARVGAEPDFFIRTSDDEHKRFVQEFVQRIYDSGHIYEDVYAGLYCIGCEEFKSEAELVDGKCPDHEIVPEWIEERNWFFRLSAFQEPLLRLYDERPDFVRPQFRYNEARRFIEGGLKDFSVSRAGQPWGVPIPWDRDQVVYVWVDALVNYLSALTYALDGEDLRASYWPVAHHLIAKDILRFHCVFWPALLLAAGYDPPREVFVHGYLNVAGRKIGKSVGNVVDVLGLADVYGPDTIRYWAARSVSFGQDADVDIGTVNERYERELGNDLGNLLSRTTAMISRYRDGRIPDGRNALAGDVARVDARVLEQLDAWDLTGALDTIWELVRRLNRYVEERKPWEQAKDEVRTGDLDETLYTLVDGLRAAAVALSSYLPETGPRILEALGQDDDLAWENVAADRARLADGVEPAPPLFPRVEAPAQAT